MVFKTVNADGQGEYFNGLADVMPNTCRAGDSFTRQLGDPLEASTRVALDFIAGRSCTAISSVKDETVLGETGELELLQPDEPTLLQRESPGIF